MASVMGRIIHQHSAGGVVLRGELPLIEVLLIKPAGRDRWQLPKGGIDQGEAAEQAAVREVREEGGVEARIIASLEPIGFFYQMSGRRIRKTVDFFAMQYVSGSPNAHDSEVDEARWFSAEDAARALTFKTERQSLAAAIEAFAVNSLKQQT